MKYKLSVSIFDDLEILQLEDLDSGNSFSLIPRLGANLNSLRLRGREVLWSAKNPAQIEKQSLVAFSGSQLFPFVNRLKDGEYEHLGRRYRFPLNEPSLNNALHGAVFDKEFALMEADEKGGFLKLAYLCDGSNSSYPFKLSVENSFWLSENGLTISTVVENKDEQSAPFGHGWHPYFIAEKGLDEAVLQIAADKYFEVDRQLIPTGELISFDRFSRARAIGSSELDYCFPLNESDKPVARLSFGAEQTISLYTSGYPYLQIYTPGDRKTIAIEPQTSAPNAFNNGIGNIVLPAKQKREMRFSISVDDNSYAR